MKKTQLRETLEQLRSELEHAKSVDKTSQALLRDVMKDIYDALERSGEEPPSGHQSLIKRLGEAASRFEETHHTLATTVGRVIDALSRMGI